MQLLLERLFREKNHYYILFGRIFVEHKFEHKPRDFVECDVPYINM